MYEIIAMVYMVWAIYAGWKFVNGRFGFLERNGVGYKVLKCICVVGIGIFYGAIYLMVLMWRFINFMGHFND